MIRDDFNKALSQARRFDVMVGVAIVPFAPKTYNHQPGWVLPGGRRTPHRDVAVACAQRMTEMMGGKK